jgi:ParB family chromosome partitioning protein
MGEIDLDPASSDIANKLIQAQTFYTAEDDGLSVPWKGRIWMNPPYSQPLVARFCEKLITHFLDEEVTEAIVLVNNSTETKWFQSLAETSSVICFPEGRVKFWHPSKVSTPLQGQAILYLGNRILNFIDNFTKYGVCLNV